MGKYKQLSKEEKTKFWQDHFDRWKETGLSQKRYCKENSVSYWNFKSWYSKVKTNGETKTTKFIKLHSKQVLHGSSGKIDIIIMNGITVRVEECISESNLKKIFLAMGYSHD